MFMPDIHLIAGGRYLNPELVAQQGLDMPRITRLQALHDEMHELKGAFVGVASEALPNLKAEVQRIEYEMQEAWGWKADASMHSHWLEVPGCTCPNLSLMGTGIRRVGVGCPVHSVEDEVPGVILVSHGPVS